MILRRQTSIPKILQTPEPHHSSDRMSDSTKLLLAGTAISLIGFDLYFYNYIYEAPPKSLNPDAFEAFDLAQITRINHDTSLFRIKARVLSLMEGGGGTLPVPSHILVKDDSCQIARAYSPVVYDKEYVDLLVKKYPDGSISRMLHDSKVGDKIWIRGPFSSMPYRSNVVKDLGMVWTRGIHAGIDCSGNGDHAHVPAHQIHLTGSSRSNTDSVSLCQQNVARRVAPSGTRNAQDSVPGSFGYLLYPRNPRGWMASRQRTCFQRHASGAFTLTRDICRSRMWS